MPNHDHEHNDVNETAPVDESSMDALLDAAFERDAAPTSHLRPGVQLGRYELVEVIAQGGMGQVWRARDPGLERDVALKVVLPERVNARALEFFTREARAGGKLSHPYVVATYAFGTDQGVSWIAQELAPGGRNVRDLLEEARRSDHEPRDYYRLVAKLVAEIAEGLQAIHEAGVIHRDLKPANVLLTADGSPKITDFGLAKVASEAALSVTGDFAGTWAYMSPEQVMAKRMGLDHRTDVFSLGVLMYELLTQRRPFDGDTTAQLAQQIVYEDPPPVSLVRSQCPKDLAVVCQHAMQKRRQDRFGSAAALAEDLRRYIAGEPIRTRPPGVLRRARHWVRRNPAKSTGLAVSAAAMTIVSWLALENAQLAENERNQAIAARASEQAAKAALARSEELARENAPLARPERDQATAARESEASAQAALARSEELLGERDAALEAEQRRAAELEQVVQFEERQLQDVNPKRMGQLLRAEIVERLDEADTTTAAALDRVDFTGVALESLDSSFFAPALRVLDEQFGDQPVLQARLLQATARRMLGAGLREAAATPQRRALELRTELLGERHPDTLESTINMGRLERLRGDLQAAAASYRRALTAARENLGDQDRITLRAGMELADCVLALGQVQEAETLGREALAGYEQLLGKEHVNTMLAGRLVGNALLRQGRLEEAAIVARENLELARAQPSRGSGHLANYAEAYGQVLMESGRYREAVALSRDLLQTFRQELGDEHQRTLAALNSVATAMRAAGDADGACELYERGLKTALRALGPTHPYTCTIREGLGAVLRDLGRYDEAEPLLREALAIARQTREPGEPALQSAISALAVLLKQHDELDEAEALYREVLGIRRETLGEQHPATLISLGNLGGLLRAKGSPEAEGVTRAAYDGMKRLRGPGHPYTLVYEGNLAFFLIQAERGAEALEVLDGHLGRARTAFGDAHDQTVGAVVLAARAHALVGDSAAARRVVEGYLAETGLPAGSPIVARLRAQLDKLTK